MLRGIQHGILFCLISAGIHLYWFILSFTLYPAFSSIGFDFMEFTVAHFCSCAITFDTATQRLHLNKMVVGLIPIWSLKSACIVLKIERCIGNGVSYSFYLSCYNIYTKKSKSTRNGSESYPQKSTLFFYIDIGNGWTGSMKYLNLF